MAALAINYGPDPLGIGNLFGSSVGGGGGGLTAANLAYSDPTLNNPPVSNTGGFWAGLGNDVTSLIGNVVTNVQSQNQLNQLKQLQAAGYTPSRITTASGITASNASGMLSSMLPILIVALVAFLAFKFLKRK